MPLVVHANGTLAVRSAPIEWRGRSMDCSSSSGLARACLLAFDPPTAAAAAATVAAAATPPDAPMAAKGHTRAAGRQVLELLVAIVVSNEMTFRVKPFDGASEHFLFPFQ